MVAIRKSSFRDAALTYKGTVSAAKISYEKAPVDIRDDRMMPG